jgi:hypothetical protein
MEHSDFSKIDVAIEGILVSRRHTLKVRYCVDYPQNVWTLWTPPARPLERPATGAPSLRLELRLIISGFQITVVSEGNGLARGINIEAFVWQTGPPGIEF